VTGRGLILLLTVSCAPGADGARQSVAVANSTIGEGYRAERTYVKACTQSAIDKAKAGQDAQPALDACKHGSAIALEVLDTASDTTDAVSAAVDAGEKVKLKSYAAVLAPLADAVASVIHVFGDLGIKLSLSGVK
jgi:hypothetical protein